MKSKFSFIVLCETWINTDEVELFNIEGYNSFHCCNDSYRSGGVICFVDEDIIVSNLNINLVTADAIFLKVNFKNVYFNLICLYRLHES